MVFVYIILALICLILLFILTAKIKIFFEYKKYPGEKLYTDYKVTISGFNLNPILKKIIKKAPENKDAKKKDGQAFVKKIKSYAKTISLVSKTYAKNRWFIRKRLKAEMIEFHLKFGLEDAAQTGIATGAIWSLLYAVLALIGQIGTLKNHNFEVVPVYTEAGFISQGSIRISFRLIGIATILYKLYSTYNKLKKNL